MIGTYRTNHQNVLAVSGGGWALPGTASSQKVQSYFLCDIMGMHYTVVNVAPVDLTYGVENLKQEALRHELKLVSANLVRKSTSEPVFDPYRVGDVKGIRVAFPGVMEEGMALAPLTTEGDDLEVLDPKASVATLLPELRSKAQVVVVFSHLGQRKTQQLVDEVKGMANDAHSTNFAENKSFFLNANDPANFERTWKNVAFVYRELGLIGTPIRFDEVMDWPP